MTFSDRDPVEEEVGSPVETMTPHQLVVYLTTYMEAKHEIKIPIDGHPERSVMAGLQRHYGNAAAGQLVKWTLYHYHGKYREDYLNVFAFSKGRRWWTDMMHAEAQAARRKEKPRRPDQVASGTMTRLSELPKASS